MRNAILLFMLIPTAIFGQQLKKIPHYFDFGPELNQVESDGIHINPAFIYSEEVGYGWTIQPSGSFVNDDFERSRHAFNIDGVAGKKLGFRLDVAPGKWLVTVFTDAGYEDSSTMILKLNEEIVNLNWHAFLPSAEPRKVIQPSYRVYQSSINVNDHIQIDLSGGNHDARLLGVSVLPTPGSLGSKEQMLLDQIVALGKYPGEGSLDEMLENLRERKNGNPDDTFAAYWYQQVELLSRAEEHFDRRGWEKYIEITGLSIWGQLHQAVMILDGLLNHSDPTINPLYERELFLRGRILYWLGLERGGPNEISRGKADLAWLYERYPDDEILAMYNGKQIKNPGACDDLLVDPSAPVWSVKQRELLCRMSDIAHWWVLEQQAENGEFGGKLGDDVELLRWWTPLLLAGDSLAFLGWSKLADEIFRSRKVYKGYSKKAIDVEHASEFIADTAPMLVVCSDRSLYMDRLRYSVDYFSDLWTGSSEFGNRFFRSSWYSSTEVIDEPPRNRDHGYNSRATKAVRYFAWKSGDSEVINALNEWSEAWLNSATKTDKGKPAGILPASIRFPDEEFNGDGENWYEADMFWEYFEWEANAGAMLLDQLLFSYSITRDQKFLEPLLKTLQLIEKYNGQTGEAERGSEAWAVDILRNKDSFWSVAAQWRFMTEDDRYDELLLEYGTPYLKYRLTGDEKYLEEGLDIVLENARYNIPLKTFEAVHTDRVYIRGYEHLTTMLTGNCSKEGLSPFYSITWEKTGPGFTALVQSTTFDELTFQIYNHSEQKSEVTARVWQLEPGDYYLILNNVENEKQPLKIRSKGDRVKLDIPPGQLTTVTITK